MFIIYRGLGLVWAILGAILALMLLVATGSVSIAMFAVAGFWIFVGRGRFEPQALVALDSEGKPRSPSVFFIPIWFYGALVVPLALVVAGIELTNGRILSSSNQGERRQAGETPGQDSFDLANNSIISARTGVAHGNTEFARTLAENYSELMKDVTDQVFTGGKEGLVSLTEGNFVTYCRVNQQDSVVFLVHVPQLQQYKGEVRDALAKLSWTAARQLLLETGAPETMTLAVGLRGSILFGPIMIGSIDAETIASTKGDRSDFYKFFVEPVNHGDDVDTEQLIADADQPNGPATEVGTRPPAEESQTELPEEIHRSAGDTDPPPRSVAPRPQQVDPAPAAPGQPVTADTELAPGQKLAARWEDAWYQVIVTGFRNDSVLTAWVHSNTWTSYAVLRSDLRLVTDAEYAACRKKYDEQPLIRPPLPTDPAIKSGDSLLCQVADFWLPVVATGPEEDGRVPIRWSGFSDQFDERVERNRLASRAVRVPLVAQDQSPASVTTPSEPGRPVTADTELRPGQKLAGRWARNWYQVIVTGFRGESVLTAWVSSNTWTSYSMQRSSLRLVTDEEFDVCLKKYNDSPKIPDPLPEAATVEPGKAYVCEVSGYWLPVVVTGSQVDGKVPIHWQGFGDQFDESVDRSRIRIQPGR